MNTLGYGRYKDDPNHVGCPRAKTDMTPCAARDGSTACTDDGVCVGCGQNPADLLTALVREVTTPSSDEPPAATRIQIQVRITAGPTERFARDALARQIGETITITTPAGRGTGKLLAAEVVDLGRAVLVTLQCDDTTIRPFLVAADSRHYSFGFTPSKDVTIKPIPAIKYSPQTDEDQRFEGQDGGNS